jgi:S1-C subfamily serine protease
LGFAIPASTAYDVIARIGEAHRQQMAGGVLGISGLDAPLDEAVVQQYGLKQQSGVLLLEVTPDGAAARASLRRGDILLALDEQPTPTVAALRQVLPALQARTPWRITFVREGRKRSVSLVPGR